MSNGSKVPTIVLSIANQKGGVGKTTTSINLGHGLAMKGHKVLIIDLDPQGHCAKSLNLKIDPDKGPGVYSLLTSKPDNVSASRMIGEQVLKSAYPGLFVLPGDKETGQAQTMINAGNQDIAYIARTIRRFMHTGAPNPHWPTLAPFFPVGGEPYEEITPIDVIIFDTAPSVGGIQERAIWASNFLLIPTKPDYLSLSGVKELGADAKKMYEEKNWRGRLIGVLPTMIEGAMTNNTKANMDDIRQIGGRLVLSEIHNATALREASSAGVSIFDFEPNCRSAKEYQGLVDYVEAHIRQSIPNTAHSTAARPMPAVQAKAATA